MLKTKQLDYILLLDENKESIKSFHIKEKGREDFEFFSCNGKNIKISIAGKLINELE
jgi:hypothetical protein